jgi:hypothetical protein
MKKFESDCVMCGRPERCGSCRFNEKLPHYYCDKCEHQDTLYRYNGEELCIDCLIEKLEVVEGSKF